LRQKYTESEQNLLLDNFERCLKDIVLKDTARLEFSAELALDVINNVKFRLVKCNGRTFVTKLDFVKTPAKQAPMEREDLVEAVVRTQANELVPVRQVRVPSMGSDARPLPQIGPKSSSIEPSRASMKANQLIAKLITAKFGSSPPSHKEVKGLQRCLRLVHIKLGISGTRRGWYHLVIK